MASELRPVPFCGRPAWLRRRPPRGSEPGLILLAASRSARIFRFRDTPISLLSVIPRFRSPGMAKLFLGSRPPRSRAVLTDVHLCTRAKPDGESHRPLAGIGVSKEQY